MVEAARAVEAAGADLVDINMGCPVPKICKTGAGAALLADPARPPRHRRGDGARRGHPGDREDAARADAGHLRRPVETARRLEAAGAAALCVHPRAAAEEYEGRADHRITAEVVAAVGVPVIASGDIVDPRATRGGCSRTRGARPSPWAARRLGYPWAFGDILAGVAPPAPEPRRGGRRDRPASPPTRALALGECARLSATCASSTRWYLAGHDVPPAELEELLTTPTLDGALARLRSLAAASAAA